MSLGRALLRIQAAYFVLTGLWSLFGVRTFQRVTGPKVDIWLVKTVGVLVTVIGGALALGARRRGQLAPETLALAAGSAAALAGIDVWYVTRGRISRVYLLDAAAEAAFFAAGALTARSDRPFDVGGRGPGEPDPVVHAEAQKVARP